MFHKTKNKQTNKKNKRALTVKFYKSLRLQMTIYQVHSYCFQKLGMTDYVHNAAYNENILMAAKTNCLRATSVQKLRI